METKIFQISEDDLKSFGQQLINDAKSQLQSEIARIQTMQYYTADQVCSILSINRTTLWRWQKKGYLKAYKIGQGIRYKSCDVSQLLGEE